MQRASVSSPTERPSPPSPPPSEASSTLLNKTPLAAKRQGRPCPPAKKGDLRRLIRSNIITCTTFRDPAFTLPHHCLKGNFIIPRGKHTKGPRSRKERRMTSPPPLSGTGKNRTTSVHFHLRKGLDREREELLYSPQFERSNKDSIPSSFSAPFLLPMQERQNVPITTPPPKKRQGLPRGPVSSVRPGKNDFDHRERTLPFPLETVRRTDGLRDAPFSETCRHRRPRRRRRAPRFLGSSRPEPLTTGLKRQRPRRGKKRSLVAEKNRTNLVHFMAKGAVKGH